MLPVVQCQQTIVSYILSGVLFVSRRRVNQSHLLHDAWKCNFLLLKFEESKYPWDLKLWWVKFKGDRGWILTEISNKFYFDKKVKCLPWDKQSFQKVSQRTCDGSIVKLSFVPWKALSRGFSFHLILRGFLYIEYQHCGRKIGQRDGSSLANAMNRMMGLCAYAKRWKAWFLLHLLNS